MTLERVLKIMSEVFGESIIVDRDNRQAHELTEKLMKFKKRIIEEEN